MKRFQQFCTSGFVLNNSNEVLIVKRADNDDSLPGYWELPGGGIDFGENPLSSVKREVFEETGLKVRIGKILTIEDYIMPVRQAQGKENEKIHRVGLFFFCSQIDATEHVLLSFEHSAYKWLAKEDLADVGMTEYMGKAISTCFANL